MLTIEKADILARAKQLCSQDGYAWEATGAKSKFHPQKVRPLATDTMRQQYIASAERIMRAERSKW
jgi:hypothetical protein